MTQNRSWRDSLGIYPLLMVAATMGMLLLATNRPQALSTATVPISAELGTSIATDLFPVTLDLNPGKIFLTDPVLLFLNPERIGMQVRFQAYDHRPQQGIALSETGSARISGTLDYDTVARQVLLYEPRIDSLRFDNSNDVTRRFQAAMRAAWSARVTSPMRAPLPPHPFLVPIRNNIQGLSYDGKVINLALSYQQ